MFESILFGEDDFQTWQRIPMLVTVGTAIMLFAFAFLSFKLILNHAKCTQMLELTTKMLMVMKKMKMASESQIFRLQNPDLRLRCRFTGHSGKGKMCQCGG